MAAASWTGIARGDTRRKLWILAGSSLGLGYCIRSIVAGGYFLIPVSLVLVVVLVMLVLHIEREIQEKIRLAGQPVREGR